MSKEQIQRFIQDIEGNPDLKQKLRAAEEGNKLSFIEIANESGYDFTVGEWEQYVKAAEKESRKLNDDELEQSTGGYIPLFDECKGHFDKKICIDGPVLNKSCPNFEYTGREVEGLEFYECGRCKIGRFGNQRLYRIPF